MLEIDRDTAHDAAQRELSKPIYPKASLTERITDWIDESIYRLVMKGSTVPGGWFTIAVLLTIAVVLVVVAIRIGRRTMRTDRGADYGLFGVAELSAAEHRATAQRYAEQANWAAAIRHRLRAVARQLEESAVLTPVPGRTANELARHAARSLPHLAAELRDAATTFNDVMYGKQPGTEIAYRDIADLDERLRTRHAHSSSAGESDTVDDTWAHLQ